MDKRKSYYDIIRILAVFLVIFNHTPGYHLPYNYKGLAFPILLFAPIVKMAVPLFFMMSGALLLSKQESINCILKKRILRFLCVIILFQLLQHAFYLACFNNGDHEISISSFVRACFTCHSFVTGRTSAWAVWFLYAYLAYLLLLPFLRCMVRNMEKIHFYYLAFLQIVLIAIVPCVFAIACGEKCEKIAISHYLFLCSNVIMWTVAGYFVENKVDINTLKKRHFLILILVSVIFIVFAGVSPEIIRESTNAQLPLQEEPNVIHFLLIPCCTFVLVVKKLFALRPPSAPVTRALQCAGEAVFSIVIIENILRLGIYKLLFPKYYSTFWPSVWVSCLALLSGLFLGIILKKMPYIRKLL